MPPRGVVDACRAYPVRGASIAASSMIVLIRNMIRAIGTGRQALPGWKLSCHVLAELWHSCSICARVWRRCCRRPVLLSTTGWPQGTTAAAVGRGDRRTCWPLICDQVALLQHLGPLTTTTDNTLMQQPVLVEAHVPFRGRTLAQHSAAPAAGRENASWWRAGARC